MLNREIYNSILVEIEKIPVIDTHDHVESEDVRTKRHIDMFNTYMIHYASCDLISSGMPEGEMAFLKNDSDDLEKSGLFLNLIGKTQKTPLVAQLIKTPSLWKIT